MKKFGAFILFAIFLLGLVPNVQASCGSANCSLIRGTQAGLTNKDRFRLDLSYRYILMKDKQKGDEDHTGEVLVPKVDFENGEIEEDHHREIKTINKLMQLDASYGITDKLTLTVAVPFFNDRHHEHDDEVTPADPAGEFTNQDGTTGFGDVSVVGKYEFFRNTKHQFIGGAGIKFATGEFELRDADGTINEPPLMPGTGSYDGIISGLYNYALIPNALSFFTSVSHRFATENPLEYEFGDSTFVDGGTVYRVNDKVSVSAQINSRISRRDTFKDMPVPSTGVTFVNFTPGVTLMATDDLWFYSHVQLPIYQRVNDVNLVPNYGLMLGVSYGF